jgi:hypothetical protein
MQHTNGGEYEFLRMIRQEKLNYIEPGSVQFCAVELFL